MNQNLTFKNSSNSSKGKRYLECCYDPKFDQVGTVDSEGFKKYDKNKTSKSQSESNSKQNDEDSQSN